MNIKKESRTKNQESGVKIIIDDNVLINLTKKVMQLLTPVDIPKYGFKINYQSKIIALGSCFAENMGEKLLQNKFNIDINAFGVLFNPSSIKNSIEIIIDNKNFDSNNLFESNGLYNSYWHHSRFSGLNANECLTKINKRINNAHLHIKNAHVLFITFGTAWVYELISSGNIVANCHKLPANLFKHKLLTVNEIITDYINIIHKLQLINPELEIVFSVSPVRHLKNGAMGNQVSKATLLLAIQQLLTLPKVHYFPAYEIVLDELRDYRFYNPDMVHPTAQAIDYIWEKFSFTFFEENTKSYISEIEKLNAARLHRPFNTSTAEYKAFAKNNLEKVENMQKLLPSVDFSIDYNFWHEIIT